MSAHTTPAGTLQPAHDAAALDLDGIRRALAPLSGDAYWQRLEELSDTPAFQAFLEDRFPSRAARFHPELVRRDFLRLMGSSLAAAGLSACTEQPLERIVPAAKSPEERVPGKPEYYATTLSLGGEALGLLVESHSGRPTKVEGNPDHPRSAGATDALAQAAILGLYDPDRSHSVYRAGQISTFEEFQKALAFELDRAEATGGAGLALLVGDHGSPTLAGQLDALVAKLPKARVHHWTPLFDDNVRAGSLHAFGQDVQPVHDLARARTIVSVDSDFLGTGLSAVADARAFADGRRGRAGSSRFNRLYALECSATVTGAMADHRLSLKPSEVEPFLRAVASRLGVTVEATELSGRALRFAEALVEELTSARGASLFVAGPWQSEAVHAMVAALNATLGNVGASVRYVAPAVARPIDHVASLRALVQSMRAGQVQTLILLGGNPVFDAPSDEDFAGALAQVPFRAHLSLYEDETSHLCHWHLPAAHFLESWSDAITRDGVPSIVQPLIAPLYGGRTAHELVARLAGQGGANAHDLVRASWQARYGGNLTERAFEELWERTLHDGRLAGVAAGAVDVRLRPLDLGAPTPAGGGLELVFRPDASAWDGRFANNAWLQETPRPLTRLTWDNAALVSPATAKRLRVEAGDVVAFESEGRRLEVPVWIAPGHADEVATLHVGYGRRRAGVLGNGVGFDAYRLRTGAAPWSVRGVQAERAGRRHTLVTVQKHMEQEHRELARVTTFDRFQHDPKHVFEHAAHHGDPSKLSMYPGWPYEGYAWGLVIDLNACTGCNACMVACQSENNVPAVGKTEVAKGREMHWIRIDRYYEHDAHAIHLEDVPPDEVGVLHQPIPCMHCEQAPCEVVCPVGATTHSPEGLNEMTYNRCVGTRYCSNNCPYKVRRFNFFQYTDYHTEVKALGNNPDVTVRYRGVMEKCTYCVQRINQARIASEKDGRKIADGEIVTACQAVCPTQAIVFGDINDPASRVAALRSEPHHYGLLEELGTRPRTTYLAKLSNPNPALARPEVAR